MITKDGRNLVRVMKEAQKNKCKYRVPRELLIDKENLDEKCNCSGACDESCALMATKVECGRQCCINTQCQNKVITQKKFVKQLGLFETESKGIGVIAKTEIPESTYVIEFVGEIITISDYLERRRNEQKNSLHSYGMKITNHLVIDGFEYGNIAKFINHSCCEPNLEVQIWTVRGIRRVTFWTTKLIRINEELTYNYKFVNFDGEKFICLCGGHNCVSKVQQNAEINLEVSPSSSLQITQEEYQENEQGSEKNFHCMVCKKKFDGKLNLLQHLKKVHRVKWKINLENPPQHVCRECSPAVVFQNNSRLKSHVFRHAEEKPCSCTKCGKIYKQQKHLVEHQRARHPEMF